MIKRVTTHSWLGLRMKRSALVIVFLLLGAVACDDESGAAKNANRSASQKAGPPVSTDEAIRVLKGLAKKDDSGSLSPTYWRRIQEGPWLDRTLAVVENVKKRGKDDPGQHPTNRPDLDPAVNAWVAKPGGRSGGWILGARQVSGYAVGGS